MNWDDLRVARAVYETGSYAAAAARLRINETTVARRLARLQEELGVTLFEAVDGQRRPSPACEELVARTAMMAGQAERIERLGVPAEGIVGRRRVATTDSLAAEVLAPRAADFLAAHPGLSLELLASTTNVNFSRWEADLAVRYAKPEKGDFVVSKLAEVTLYLCQPAAGDAAAAGGFVCAYPEDLDLTPESQFLIAAGLQPHTRFVTKNLLVSKPLLRSGRCTCVLPSYMCADLIDDTTYRLTELPQRRSIWLLVQAHLKQDAATRAVIDWIRACFRDVE